MSADDRPFECPEKDCGMRFANEDHLSVHKMKHEMSLPLTPGTGGGKHGGLLFVADQTPTPTKFLRNCEEIGLFNDINIKNPFEEAFKKAAYEHPPHSEKCETITLNVPTTSSLGTLNTPTPMFQYLDVRNLDKTHSNSEPEYIPLPGPDSDAGSTLDTPTPDIFKSTEIIDMDGAIDLRVTENKTSSSSSRARKTPEPLFVSDTILLDSYSQESQISESSLAESPGGSTTSSVIGSPGIITIPSRPPSTPSTPVATTKPMYMQVLLQVSPGVSIPVQIPANLGNNNLTVVPSSGLSTISTVKPDAATTTSNVTSLVNAPLLTAKQKLKAAITQNVQQSVLNNNMRVMSEAVERVTSQSPGCSVNQQAAGSLSLGRPGIMFRPAATAAKVQTQAADTSTPFNYHETCDFSNSKRSKKSAEEDPEERRRKFLERNRAAAARCRMKKKHRIGSLECKADDLLQQNNKLQTEVNGLRGEVAQLKSLLMAHKDCPIFQQQRNMGQLNLEPTTPKSAAASGDGPPPAKKAATLTVGKQVILSPNVVSLSAPITLVTGTSTVAAVPKTLRIPSVTSSS